MYVCMYVECCVHVFLVDVTSISNVRLGSGYSSYVQRHIDLVLSIYFISHYFSMV